MIRFRVRRDPDPMMVADAKWEVAVILDGGDEIWLWNFSEMWIAHAFLDRLFDALAPLEQELIETYFRPV